MGSSNAQRRVRWLRQQEAQARRRRRGLVVSAVVILALTLAVGVGIGVQRSRVAATTSSAGAPAGTVATFGIPRGQQSAPVTLTIFEDFQCPACRAVEAYVGATIDEYVERGTVRVVYRPMAFLDDASTTEYSSRALGAAACVVDEAGRDSFVRLHDLLFANQPPEGSAGLSDEKLVDLATQVGAPRSPVTVCMESGRFAGWVAAATEQASKDGVRSTPTLLVDGRVLAFNEREDPQLTLRAAIAAAAQS